MSCTISMAFFHGEKEYQSEKMNKKMAAHPFRVWLRVVLLLQLRTTCIILMEEL